MRTSGSVRVVLSFEPIYLKEAFMETLFDLGFFAAAIVVVIGVMQLFAEHSEERLKS